MKGDKGVQVGDKYVCTSAQSCGYKKGKIYTVVKNSKDELCFYAGDGYFDPLGKLVSKFKPVGFKVIG